VTRPRRSRLGWLGPILFAIGVIVAAGGVWLFQSGRPKPGAVIDTIAVDRDTQIRVLAEDGGDRNFVELRHGDRVEWQALVPPYGGRPGVPGIAWNDIAVTVRVVRNGRAEVFALARRDASKLGGFTLAPNHGPIAPAATGPVTLTDHQRAYEFVAGPDWHQLVGVDLATGVGLWRVELGPTAVATAGIDGETIWVVQNGQRRGFRTRDGSEITR
jgi:hypothetical protein